MNLKGRDLLTVLDFTEEELRYILNVAKNLKVMNILGEKIGSKYNRQTIVRWSNTLVFSGWLLQ